MTPYHLSCYPVYGFQTNNCYYSENKNERVNDHIIKVMGYFPLTGQIAGVFGMGDVCKGKPKKFKTFTRASIELSGLGPIILPTIDLGVTAQRALFKKAKN